MFSVVSLIDTTKESTSIQLRIVWQSITANLDWDTHYSSYFRITVTKETLHGHQQSYSIASMGEYGCI